MKLPELLGLDSNCFVYFIEDPEDSARRTFLARHVFGPMAAGGLRGVTSAITVAELLAAAYKQDEPERAEGLRSALEAIPNLEIAPVDVELADRAAEMRGRAGGKLPDAIQAATGVVSGAGAVLTNDRELRRFAGSIPVLLIDEVVNGGPEDG